MELEGGGDMDSPISVLTTGVPCTQLKCVVVAGAKEGPLVVKGVIGKVRYHASLPSNSTQTVYIIDKCALTIFTSTDDV